MRRVAVLCLLAIVAAMPAAADPGAGWITYGNGVDRGGATGSVAAAALRAPWALPLEGRVSSQILAVRDVPEAGATTIYVATSAGRIYALAPNGYVRWQAELGQLARPCPQLDGWGVTGTPAIDVDTRALYAVDPFGRLHALDLATGTERDGWPQRIFDDFRQEHVFAALTVLRGAIYVPTASYCDDPMEGKIIRVSTSTGEVTATWVSVPFRLGGGGGIWGFAGLAYSARRDSLFAATGNAFRGGQNVGRNFKEYAGYGEQLVELSPDLDVRAASHPPDLDQELDLDFGSGPVVFTRPGCPELVAAVNKNATLYAWRTDDVAAGPAWSLRLRSAKLVTPVIGQPAYAPRFRSLYVTTGSRLLRVALTAACRPRLLWSAPLTALFVQGSPTVAGDVVWLSVSGPRLGLVGFDARSGRARFRSPLHGDAFAAPTAIGGSLFAGTFAGWLHGFVAPRTRVGAGFSEVDGHSSFPDRRRGWVSRETGVYATDDGGRTWRRILRRPALRVLRLSTRLGVVSTGSQDLWTDDGGRSWRKTAVVDASFAGRGRLLFSTDSTTLRRVAWPPRRATTVARLAEGRIVDLASVPGGVAALVSNRAHGRNWDPVPKLLLWRNGRLRTIELPAAPGRALLARRVTVAWPRIDVEATDYLADSETGTATVTWTSADGGASWRVSAAAPAGP